MVLIYFVGKAGCGMARKLRVEYPGAIYHLINRGDRREAIFKDDADCQRFLDVVKGPTIVGRMGGDGGQRHRAAGVCGTNGVPTRRGTG